MAWYRVSLALTVLSTMLAAAGAAQAQSERDPLTEFLRKVEARESENGVCATTGWPQSSRAGYVHFLESARVGFGKLNAFSDGSCQFDRVISVSETARGKCVRYVWSTCAPGATCGRGEDEDCKQPDGNWQRTK